MPPLSDRETPTVPPCPALGIYTSREPTGVRHRIVAVDTAAHAVNSTPAGIDVRMHHDRDPLADRGGQDQDRAGTGADLTARLGVHESGG
ncbi:MAG TPA: hypothetical protein VM347_35130 [Nonomuraea sp.]|nr:hypothetical protein [Nonomuraea sp.]